MLWACGSLQTILDSYGKNLTAASSSWDGKANPQASMGLKALLKVCIVVVHHAAGSN